MYDTAARVFLREQLHHICGPARRTYAYMSQKATIDDGCQLASAAEISAGMLWLSAMYMVHCLGKGCKLLCVRHTSTYKLLEATFKRCSEQEKVDRRRGRWHSSSKHG